MPRVIPHEDERDPRSLLGPLSELRLRELLAETTADSGLQTTVHMSGPLSVIDSLVRAAALTFDQCREGEDLLPYGAGCGGGDDGVDGIIHANSRRPS